jgi:hypothetical protein
VKLKKGNVMKKLLLACTASATILIAGCTSAQVEANINAACTALGAGASAVVVVAGLIPGGVAISTEVNGLITSVTADCPAFSADVAAAVAAISNIGGSGTITVSSQTASMKATGQRAKVVVFHFGPYGT